MIALRDAGTSYHCLPAADFSHAAPSLLQALDGAFAAQGEPVPRGATRTTDAPFRESQGALDAMRGLRALEMDAAAQYAFAAALKSVICFAHVTNQIGQIEGDYERGAADGAALALAPVRPAAGRLSDRP